MADQGDVAFLSQQKDQGKFPIILGEFWGTGTITSIVTINGALGKRRVILFHRGSRRIIDETQSDSVTGVYTFTGIATGIEFLTLGLDETGLNAEVADLLIAS